MLERAKRLLEQGEHEQCFLLLKENWLSHPDCLETIRLLAQLLKTLGRAELAATLVQLSRDEHSLSDVQNLFEAGYQLIDNRQHELAALLLTRCLALAPDEPTINYELGFTLLSLKRYAQAIPHFNRSLQAIDDFDTRLNLAVAHLCLRDPEPVRSMLDAMASLAASDEEKAELSQQKLVLKRLEQFNRKKVLSARDWLYIHYGSALLKQSDDQNAGGKFGQLLDDYTECAKTLLLLRGMLEGLGQTFEFVEYYSTLSRPLAQALAEILGLPCEIYKGANRQEQALLVMAWGSDILGPHESFKDHQPQRSIFAYALTASEPLPIAPEIVGCLADACALPWAERFRLEQWHDGRPDTFETDEGSTEDPQTSAERLLDKTSRLEADPDLLNQIHAIVAYYDARRDGLILGNSEAFPSRPEYSAEVP
jgi:tetratricopeptide (TPR) repeat protein